MAFDCLLSMHTGPHRGRDQDQLRRHHGGRHGTDSIVVLDNSATINTILLRCLISWNQDVGFLTMRGGEIGPVVLEKEISISS